jgi:hypothetical protein
MTSDNATEEFKRISEFMRTYLVLRLYRLTLLLGTSGAIVTALSSDSVRRRGAIIILLLKLGTVAISLAFTIMDFSASGPLDSIARSCERACRYIAVSTFPRSFPMESVYGDRRRKLSPCPNLHILGHQLVAACGGISARIRIRARLTIQPFNGSTV